MSSIAVSAFVVPSRRLRFTVGAYALAHLVAAACIAWIWPERIAFSFPVALFFLAAAVFLLHGCAALTKTHQIDVSGTGTVRLTVQQKLGTGSAADAATDVKLLPGSLFWPQLMLLRLGDRHGNIRVVPVLRDSLAPNEYRALRVALGTVCERTVTSESASEIL